MDTIAAIATPIGTAGIGVIRISGPTAVETASRMFMHGGIEHFPTHTAHHGALCYPRTNDHIDDVVLTVFRAPTSYTGEDVVEISCHGGVATLRAALDAALDAGARLAEPGEFTKRAFLNGKIDLAQAEAVNDLIRAGTDSSRAVALRQLEGGLSTRIRQVNERVLGVVAAIEAAIDFPDDVPEPDPVWIESEVLAVRTEIDELLSSFGRGRIYREGLRVVIVGRVNVGKSSLLNALLRHARAIVTPIPGTTRDAIEESLQIQGIPIVAIDTAGLRDSEDPVERIGIEMTAKSLESADIVLLVLDISEGITDADIGLMDRIADKPAIAVLNKVDLLKDDARCPDADGYLETPARKLPAVRTSASSGEGVDELEDRIAALVGAEGVSTESIVVTNLRHQRALASASESLSHVLTATSASEPIDLLSVDLIAARSALGLVTGETASEDLVDRIFSEFCIGK